MGEGDGNRFNRWFHGEDHVVDLELTRGGDSYTGTYVGHIRVHVSVHALRPTRRPSNSSPGGVAEAGLLAVAIARCAPSLSPGASGRADTSRSGSAVQARRGAGARASDEPITCVDDSDPLTLRSRSSNFAAWHT